MEGVTVYGHLPECHVTFGEGNVVLFNEIPILPRNFLRDDFQTFLDISLPEKRI